MTRPADTVNVDTLVEKIEEEAGVLHGNGDIRFSYGSDVALKELRAALSDLAARARKFETMDSEYHELWHAETDRAEAAEVDRDRLQRQVSELVRAARSEQIRANNAETDRDRLARRVAELEQVCEKAIRERRSLESKEDDWHSAYERSEGRVAELEQQNEALTDKLASWEEAEEAAPSWDQVDGANQRFVDCSQENERLRDRVAELEAALRGYDRLDDAVRDTLDCLYGHTIAKTVADQIAASKQALNKALEDYGAQKHGAALAGDGGGAATDEWFIPEGDRQCGVVHRDARATCMKRQGHDGPHGTPNGTWIDGPWCEYPAGDGGGACDGSSDCEATVHLHGCYSDDGTSCDHPSEHAAVPIDWRCEATTAKGRRCSRLGSRFVLWLGEWRCFQHGGGA